MLRNYLFQPVVLRTVAEQVQEQAGLILSVSVLSCIVWLPDEGNVVMPTQSLRFIQHPEIRKLVAGALARLPNCPIKFTA
ncbi:MAG: hypothetical protein DCC55_39400 [Chloroflexi bacterium]|nr:MAG: hypothetical protein DCC55_39400 [Chloroflexota bacterium]